VGFSHQGQIASTHELLTPEQVGEILELTRAAGDADGAYPLSEHVVLHLRHGGETPAIHILARDGAGQLLGYAHVDTTDVVEGPSAELCVHPLARRRGLGRALVSEAIEIADRVDGRLRLWAHGDHPSAGALALSLGFTRWRVLWQLRRSLYTQVPAPELPDGVTLRPFQAGTDEKDWLALNAQAFADLPDQGRWSSDDLRVRMAEQWFDPAGFLIAERDGEMLGFHWTKVHGALRHSTVDAGARRSRFDGAHEHDPIGEVYVIGVSPAARGTGLGRALTLAGLRHLRELGLDQVMLYVDETNRTAIALYERLGFARWSTDVCFRRVSHP